ncbi:hypothetical protein GBAR_LOCUS15006, partial [Geodia barretti]
GILILNDDSGQITATIEAQYRPDQTRITKAILQRWLEGTGRTLQSWATLITVLREVDLNVLAKHIKDNLAQEQDPNHGGPSSIPSPSPSGRGKRKRKADSRSKPSTKQRKN